jgi:hypothetical protein
MTFKYGDGVILAQDISEAGLRAGTEGVVIYKFTKPELAYEVEFFKDDSGIPCAQLALLPEQLLPEAAHLSSYSEEESALDNSVQVKPTSPRRVGINVDSRVFMIFDITWNNSYHGHVRSLTQLNPDMLKALRRAGLIDKHGNIL